MSTCGETYPLGQSECRQMRGLGARDCEEKVSYCANCKLMSIAVSLRLSIYCDPSWSWRTGQPTNRRWWRTNQKINGQTKLTEIILQLLSGGICFLVDWLERNFNYKALSLCLSWSLTGCRRSTHDAEGDMTGSCSRDLSRKAFAENQLAAWANQQKTDSVSLLNSGNGWTQRTTLVWMKKKKELGDFSADKSKVSGFQSVRSQNLD